MFLVSGFTHDVSAPELPEVADVPSLAASRSIKKKYIKITSAVYYQFAKERRQQLNKCFDHATASSPRDSNDSQGPEPLSGSRGLHWQSRDRTPVWVQGAALTMTRTPVWVQGAALTVKDQNPCLGPGGCIDKSRTRAPVWVHGASPQLCTLSHIQVQWYPPLQLWEFQ